MRLPWQSNATPRYGIEWFQGRGESALLQPILELTDTELRVGIQSRITLQVKRAYLHELARRAANRQAMWTMILAIVSTLIALGALIISTLAVITA
jgi:hypothetical protein